ncbi:primosomal protein N' [Chryseomicrobium palamuruense]|uniref:primosomal protein N' n=1 Tax=Chryseomicrobium palamuruense TaxID=682973 RepID=UPI003A8D1B7B
MIAKVIVDVSTAAIDRPFDYQVPEEWEAFIQPGVRVHVPFGPRKVQGFVIGIDETSQVESAKLKPLQSVIDVEPVLTKELLELAKWLKDDTLCFYNDALQVMIPAALRAAYSKIVHVDSSVSLSQKFESLLSKDREVDFQQIEKAKLLPELKHLLQNQLAEIETRIRQRSTPKKQTVYHVASVPEEIGGNAKKQLQVLEWIREKQVSFFTLPQLQQDFSVTGAVVEAMVQKGYLTKKKQEIYREIEMLGDASTDKVVELTDKQNDVLSQIITSADQQQSDVFLLHGITGSGKTEIYLHAIEHTLSLNKEAIMLVPEIALTPQMVLRFKMRFGEQVAVMHSGLSIGEKYDEWRKVIRKEVKVVVGARSAIFAPFENLGLLILDEEHESSYKQEDSPRYHAREVAKWRAEFAHCPVILGSATPSIESYARATKGVYHLVKLPGRANAKPLPPVELIDMREQLKGGNRSMFSIELADAIRDRLAKREQIVLFLNKRGFSSFVLCRDCGSTVQCPNCDISLTYHRMGEALRCHYCGYEEQVPTQCPQCKSEHIRFFGTGTQKVEEELTRLFPEARTLRMDVDTTRTKGAHERILHHFGQKQAEILLGTQMIAKGLDFPDVTLVGVLNADTSLHLADFRAAEKTFQLITQVSGRAGRHEKEGKVIVQTYDPDHYALEYAKMHDYVAFYTKEMQIRKVYEYPPFYYLTHIQISHPDVLVTAEYADKVASWLRDELSNQATVIGPTASAISRIQDRYRYQCIIKYKKEPNLIPVLHQLLKLTRSEWEKQGVRIGIDLHPSTLV